MSNYILKLDQDGNVGEDCFAYELKQLFDKYSIKSINNGSIGYDQESKEFVMKDCIINSDSANGTLIISNENP